MKIKKNKKTWLFDIFSHGDIHLRTRHIRKIRRKLRSIPSETPFNLTVYYSRKKHNAMWHERYFVKKDNKFVQICSDKYWEYVNIIDCSTCDKNCKYEKWSKHKPTYK